MAYSNEQFQTANREIKLAMLVEIAEGISHKYTTTNSFRISKDDLVQELSLTAWQMLESTDYSQHISFYIKGMYNKAVDVYNKYKKLRKRELNFPEVAFDFEIMFNKVKDKSLDEDQKEELDSIAKKSMPTFSTTSNLGDTDLMELTTLVSDLLELPLDDLEKKYILIKLYINDIFDLVGIDKSTIKELEDVDFSAIDGEYDVVLALDHYTSPKSGSWYGKKALLKDLIKRYLNEY